MTSWWNARPIAVARRTRAMSLFPNRRLSWNWPPFSIRPAFPLGPLYPMHFVLALVALLVSGVPANAARVEEGDSTRTRSPLSFVSGGHVGLAWTGLDYEQNAPDSAATYSGNGIEYLVGIAVRIREDRFFLLANYAAAEVGSDTEETRHRGGVGFNSLEPDLRRLGLRLAAESPGPWHGRYRAELGYDWMWSDFLRRDFRGAVGVPGQLFTSENYDLAGVSLAGSVIAPVGRVLVAGRALRLRLEGEGIFLQDARVESRGGAVFDTNGFSWNGRAGLETGTDTWRVGLAWRMGAITLDATGFVTSPLGPVRRGESEIRTRSLALIVRLGHS